MRIGIDARAASHPQRGGFKTYTESLIHALAEVDDTNSYVLFVDRPVARDMLPTGQRITVKMVRGDMPLAGMPLREQVLLPLRAALDRLDLLHAPCATAPVFVPCPVVVTLHDAIDFLPPKTIGPRRPTSPKRLLMDHYQRMIAARTTRQALAVITVSDHSGHDIVACLGVPKEKVFAIPEAHDPRFRPLPESAVRRMLSLKYNLANHYLLMIGSADPRKNLVAALRAYAGLEVTLRSKVHLVIVWTHAYLLHGIREVVRDLGIAATVRSLERVPDEDLHLLYCGAQAFLFPSLYEGFGLPPLESMACGTPVVCSNRTSIPEVVGDAAMLVNPLDVEEMAAALTALLTDEGLRQRMVQKGLARAACFSWAETARQTIRVYEQVCEMARDRAQRGRQLANARQESWHRPR